MTQFRRTRRASPQRRREHLREVGLASSARVRYTRQVRAFLEFTVHRHGAYPCSFQHLDFELGEYINLLYQEGEPASYAADCLAGLQRLYPACRRQLPTAWQYYSNWQTEALPQRALPLPTFAVKGMAAACGLLGRWDLAALLILGFVGLLRTSELAHLQLQHVRVARPDLAVVALPLTKTTRRKKGAEVVTVHDPTVIRIVERALSEAVGAALYQRQAHVFPAEFQALCRWAGLEDRRFTPYSLRRGGATWHFLMTGSLDSTILKGRWQSAKTARIYIEDAAAQGALVSLPPHTQAQPQGCIDGLRRAV